MEVDREVVVVDTFFIASTPQASALKKIVLSYQEIIVEDRVTYKPATL